jgi:hypothetical protein
MGVLKHLCSTEWDLCMHVLTTNHTVEFEGFVGLDFRTLLDQNCTTLGPKVYHLRQVEFC